MSPKVYFSPSSTLIFRDTVLSLLSIRESEITLASLYPISLYLFTTLVRSSLKSASINFERFKTLIGFFFLVFFIAFLRFLSLKTLFPSKSMFLIFTLSPLLIATIMLTIGFSIESFTTSIVFTLTLALRKPFFLYLLSK